MQASVGSIVLGEDGIAGYRYTERNQYDPFGKQNESTSFSQVENNIKYGGSMSDSSGLYYMGARHYDPNVGRFLQQDSYKGDRYSPWTQNLYTYTSNNPVNYIDPTGHRSLKLVIGKEEIVGGVKEKVKSGATAAVKQNIEEVIPWFSDNSSKDPENIWKPEVDNQNGYWGFSQDYWIAPAIAAANNYQTMKDKSIMHDYVVFYMAMYLGGSFDRYDTKIIGAGRKKDGSTDGFPDIARINVINNVTEVWEVKANTPYGKRAGRKQMLRYTQKEGYIPGETVPTVILPYVGGNIVVTGGVGLDKGLIFYEYNSTYQTNMSFVDDLAGAAALVGLSKVLISMMIGNPMPLLVP